MRDNLMGGLIATAVAAPVMVICCGGGGVILGVILGTVGGLMSGLGWIAAHGAAVPALDWRSFKKCRVFCCTKTRRRGQWQARPRSNS